MYKLERKLHAISALLFVCILVLGVFVACACTNGFKTINPYGWFDKKTEAAQGEDNNGDLEIEEVVTSSYIRLLAGAEATTASDSGIAKTLTATVYPSDAPNKQVDWDLYWAEDADLGDQPIGDYLTLTPASDGATSATLRCLQPFHDSVAYVKVTTRVGGYEAVCAVRFAGVPESISLDTVDLSNDTGVNGFQYLIPVNEATSISINLDNVYGDVGDDYYNNLQISTFAGYGSIKIQDCTVSQSGTSWSGNESQITLDSIKGNILTVALNGSDLVITPNKLVENYYQSITGTTASTTYLGKFKSYVANSAGSANVTPFFKVVVQCGNLYAEFSFRIISTVTGVSLSGDVTY